MTLRLDEEQSRTLRELAEQENRSQHAVIESAIKEYADRHSRRAALDNALDVLIPQYAELRERLS